MLLIFVRKLLQCIILQLYGTKTRHLAINSLLCLCLNWFANILTRDMWNSDTKNIWRISFDIWPSPVLVSFESLIILVFKYECRTNWRDVRHDFSASQKGRCKMSERLTVTFYIQLLVHICIDMACLKTKSSVYMSFFESDQVQLPLILQRSK